MGPQGPPTRAAPSLVRALRDARVPPMDYLDKPPSHRGRINEPEPGVQFLLSERVQFWTSVDICAQPVADDGVIFDIAALEAAPILEEAE